MPNHLDRQFADALDKVREETRQQMEPYWPKGDPPTRQRRWIEFISKEAQHPKVIEEPDYQDRVWMLTPIAESSEAARRLWKLMKFSEPYSSCADQSVGCAAGRRLFSRQFLIESFFCWFLESTGSLRPNRRALTRFVGKVRKHCESSRIIVKRRIYLEGIETPHQVVRLGSVRLEPVSIAHLEMTWNKNWHFRRLYGMGDWPLVHGIRAMLTEELKANKIVGQQKVTAFPSDKLNDVLSALRIASDSPIGTSPMFETCEPLPTRLDTSVIGRGASLRNTHGGRLSEGAIRQVRDRSGDIAKIRSIGKKAWKILNIALQRLESFDQNSSIQDRVLDLFVGFEAVVLGRLASQENNIQELSLRLALGVANYLATTPESRIEAFKAMKKGYTLRSKIIHGSALERIDQDKIHRLSILYREILNKWIKDEAADTLPEPDKLLLNIR